jgi:hypothetical protein
MGSVSNDMDKTIQTMRSIRHGFQSIAHTHYLIERDGSNVLFVSMNRQPVVVPTLCTEGISCLSGDTF